LEIKPSGGMDATLAGSVFPPRLLKWLWTGQTNVFKTISAIRMNLNQQTNCCSLNC
jgi:hypothetical protein